MPDLSDLDEEDFYAAAVMQEVKELPAEELPAAGSENKPEITEESSLPEENKEQIDSEKVKEIFDDISGTLKLLQDQIIVFQKNAGSMPKMVTDLSEVLGKASEMVKDMPKIVHEQCLEEYKNIVNNSSKNYQQFQISASKWQTALKKQYDKDFKWIVLSSALMPIMMVLLIIDIVLRIFR